MESRPKDISENIDLTVTVIGENPGLVLEKAYGQKRAAEPCQMTSWYAAAVACDKDVEVMGQGGSH